MLDDPIAAVDAHVAKHIYTHCIMGLLKGKTIVLCTHHVAYLGQTDHVIVMEDGEVKTQGAPDQVLNHLNIHDALPGEQVDSPDMEHEESSSSHAPEKKKDSEIKNEDDGKLVEDEEKRYGKVAFKVYKLYWKSFGSVMATVAFLTILLTEATRNVQDWWLSYWVTNTAPHSNNNNNSISIQYKFFHHTHRLSTGISSDALYYLSVYGYIIIGYLAFVITAAFLNGIGSVRASRKLHQSLLSVVLKTPIAFFDVTPVGRIINR